MKLSIKLRNLALKLADANDAKYLVQLNFKALQAEPPAIGVDKKNYYQQLQEQAKLGPIFNSKTIKFISNLRLELDKNVVKWLATCYQNERIEIEKLPSILDYIRNNKVELDKLPWQQVIDLSDHWHEQFKGKTNIGNYKTKNIDYDFKNGYSMVIVSAEDLETEGNFMGHCVGDYDKQVKSGITIIYSLRDSKNKPHVTIEVAVPYNEVVQIQGKENRDPIQKYHAMIDEWLESKKLHNNETIKYITDINKLEELAKSESEDVRSSVARNLNTPANVLEKLAKDKIFKVRDSAISTLESKSSSTLNN
jgi:gas vesicle protein